MNNNSIFDKEIKEIKDRIESIIPNVKIYAFGSRIKKTSNRYSDFDIAIDGKEKISLLNRFYITEALQDSDLPYSIDFCDYNNLSDSFREQIDTYKLEIS